ncbi:hypothetical protein Tco_0915235 [Tanacetum coccineum]
MFVGTNPSVLLDKTKSTGDGLKTAHAKIGTNLESSKTEKESKADEDVTFWDDEFNTSSDFFSSDDTKKEIKLKDLYKLVQDARTDFMDLDLPEDDEPIIVQDDSNEEVHTENVHTKEPKETADASAPHPPSLSSLPTEEKEIPSKFNELTGVVFEYASKKAGDHGVPSAGLAGTYPAKGKKNTQQIIISQLFQRKAIKVAKKANLNKPIPTTTPATSTILLIITTTATQLQYPFLPSGEHVHFTKEQIKEQKRIKESVKVDAAKQEVEARKEEWIDLLGVDVVTKYYKAKLQYDKYYEKFLNRRAQLRITNCVVLTRKGLITFKVYREDGTDKVIPTFKASDLHLGKWREVVKACPNISGKGWSIIYEQIQTRMDYLYKTEAELGNDLDKPLGE